MLVWFCVQLRTNVFKWLVFHLCLWRKSYYMKRGIKHDKVRCLAVLVIGRMHTYTAQSLTAEFCCTYTSRVVLAGVQYYALLAACPTDMKIPMYALLMPHCHITPHPCTHCSVAPCISCFCCSCRPLRLLTR
jgi:hypothetical protein